MRCLILNKLQTGMRDFFLKITEMYIQIHPAAFINCGKFVRLTADSEAARVCSWSSKCHYRKWTLGTVWKVELVDTKNLYKRITCPVTKCFCMSKVFLPGLRIFFFNHPPVTSDRFCLDTMLKTLCTQLLNSSPSSITMSLKLTTSYLQQLILESFILDQSVYEKKVPWYLFLVHSTHIHITLW